MSNFKRHRTPSHTSRSSTESALSAEHVSKAARSGLPDDQVGSTTKSDPSGEQPRLLCTLPPTCNPPHRSTPLANTKDLEAHYATYHAHVCEEPKCNAVFPDARLLELHQTECHDPLARIRQDRGEKIFACHISTCDRLFQNPKGRRLHLIQAHGYPKEYFFAVTNKGVGGLLQKWGEGVSLIRGEWKPRDKDEGKKEGDTSVDMDTDEDAPDDDTAIEVDRPDDDRGVNQGRRRTSGKHTHTASNEDALDSLMDSMNSLSLVPSSIRFGRGGRKGGFKHEQPHVAGTSGGDSNPYIAGGHHGHHKGQGGGKGRGRGSPEVEKPPIPSSPPKRGTLGQGGRGRAGIARGVSRGGGI